MKKNGNLMMAAVLVAVTVLLSLTTCASGPSPEELKRQQAEQAGQQERLERDSWSEEASRIMDELKGLDGGKTQADKLGDLYGRINFTRTRNNLGRQMDIGRIWKENKSAYQAALQDAKDWIAAEPARQAEREQARAEQEKAAEAQRAANARAIEEHRAARAAANANGVTAADFEYDINESGDGIVITLYKGLATVVNIPAVIEGFPVKSLGMYRLNSDSNYVGVFSGNREITSVTIPDSVTGLYSMVSGTSGFIGGVFAGCTSLASVTFRGNVWIGRGTFARCTALSTLTINGNISLVKDAGPFQGCPITTVNIGPNVTGIENAHLIPQDNLPIANKAAINRVTVRTR
jgi:hypothetical protein